MKSKVKRQEDALGVIRIKYVGQNNSIWIILKINYFWEIFCLATADSNFRRTFHSGPSNTGRCWQTHLWWWLGRPHPSLPWKCPGTMRGQLAPTLPLGREKSPPRQYPMKGQVMDRLDTFATIWTTWLRQQYELGHRPSTETSPWMTIWTFFAWKLAGM
jgi:hypothetical protein